MQTNQTGTIGRDDLKQNLGKLLPAVLVMLAVTLSFLRTLSFIPSWVWVVAILALFFWATSRVLRP